LKYESSERRMVTVQETKKAQINEILMADTAFLASFNIMDYSLYLVIEGRSYANAIHRLTRHEFFSEDGHELYHVSVIDYLQEWNRQKKMERWLKSWKKLDPDDLSAVEPVFYRKRFCDFMRKQVFDLN
jgi:hypothetical protein